MNKAQKLMVDAINHYAGRTPFDVYSRTAIECRYALDRYCDLLNECNRREGYNFGIISYNPFSFTVGYIYPDYGTNEPRARVITPTKVYDFIIDE